MIIIESFTNALTQLVPPKKSALTAATTLTFGLLFSNDKICLIGCDFDKLVNELEPFDFDTFKNSSEEFYAVVTNIESGEAEYKKIKDFDTKNNIEYLRASGSMPYVSKPVIIENKKYLDGGIADSIPIEKIMEK